VKTCHHPIINTQLEKFKSLIAFLKGKWRIKNSKSVSELVNERLNFYVQNIFFNFFCFIKINQTIRKCDFLQDQKAVHKPAAL